MIRICQVKILRATILTSHLPRNPTLTLPMHTITIRILHTLQMEVQNTSATAPNTLTKNQKQPQKHQESLQEISNAKDPLISTQLRNWTAKTMSLPWRILLLTKTNKTTSKSATKTPEHHLPGTLITSPEKALLKSATINSEIYSGNKPSTKIDIFLQNSLILIYSLILILIIFIYSLSQIMNFILKIQILSFFHFKLNL